MEVVVSSDEVPLFQPQWIVDSFTVVHNVLPLSSVCWARQRARMPGLVVVISEYEFGHGMH